MSRVKTPYVKYEKVPKDHVVNYSVERRSVDWQDFDKVLNVGDWLKINLDRDLVLAKYKEFRTAMFFSFIIIFIIGFAVGWLI